MTSLRARLMKGGFFSQQELETAKTSNEVSSAYDREVGQKFALSLASIWTSTGKLDFYTTYINVMKTITLDEIDAALKKYLSRPYILGALMPQGSKSPNFSEMSKDKSTATETHP
jgi:predicted Zn-dependent peptidase